ncbi:expressed unknown protein [Seminavis robusta]|uniref:Uncharacterized protein n=1 Tax=Seminavis robusta TaxID=568900 RepID=A0A9N8F1X0_9STRA|nr:expressed unknown protein [Seminavis robusta]|eukprot:Sro2609_g332500.1 n/a (214) ;mRNA; r:10273-11177
MCSEAFQPTLVGRTGRGISNELGPPAPSAAKLNTGATSPSSTALAYTVSPEPIHTVFNVATFGPQPFWLLIILLPKSDVTKKIMGGFEIVLLFCLVHFFIVSGSIVMGGSEATAPLAEFNDVFDPAGDPQNAFIKMVSNYPNFVAEEWSHVLTWDLLVGRFIWLDGLKRNIFTSHSVLLTNLIGPPGLLLHWLTCLVVGKAPWEREEDVENVS